MQHSMHPARPPPLLLSAAATVALNWPVEPDETRADLPFHLCVQTHHPVMREAL